MKSIKVSIFIVVIFSLQMVSCKKKVKDPFTSDYQNMMRQNALIEAAFDDVLKISENIMMKNGDARLATTGAPLGCISDIDTVVTGPNKKTYTINFLLGCSDYDGKERAGKIIIEMDGASYNTAGAVLTFRFENYYINYSNLQGKMIMTNEGNGVYKVVVSDESGSGYATLNIVDIGISQWKSTHKRTITNGYGDNIILDNKYHIENYDPGINTFDGFTTDDKHYYANPSSILILDYSCTASGSLRYPTYGILKYKLEENPRDVDYGDSTLCDYTVLMTDGISTTTFSLY